MVSEAVAAQNTKVPRQGTIPDKDGSFLNLSEFQAREKGGRKKNPQSPL